MSRAAIARGYFKLPDVLQPGCAKEHLALLEEHAEAIARVDDAKRAETRDDPASYLGGSKAWQRAFEDKLIRVLNSLPQVQEAAHKAYLEGNRQIAVPEGFREAKLLVNHNQRGGEDFGPAMNMAISYAFQHELNNMSATERDAFFRLIRDEKYQASCIYPRFDGVGGNTSEPAASTFDMQGEVALRAPDLSRETIQGYQENFVGAQLWQAFDALELAFSEAAVAAAEPGDEAAEREATLDAILTAHEEATEAHRDEILAEYDAQVSNDYEYYLNWPEELLEGHEEEHVALLENSEAEIAAANRQRIADAMTSGSQDRYLFGSAKKQLDFERKLTQMLRHLPELQLAAYKALSEGDHRIVMPPGFTHDQLIAELSKKGKADSAAVLPAVQMAFSYVFRDEIAAMRKAGTLDDFYTKLAGCDMITIWPDFGNSQILTSAVVTDDGTVVFGEKFEGAVVANDPAKTKTSRGGAADAAVAQVVLGIQQCREHTGLSATASQQASQAALIKMPLNQVTNAFDKINGTLIAPAQHAAKSALDSAATAKAATEAEPAIDAANAAAEQTIEAATLALKAAQAAQTAAIASMVAVKAAGIDSADEVFTTAEEELRSTRAAVEVATDNLEEAKTNKDKLTPAEEEGELDLETAQEIANQAAKHARTAQQVLTAAAASTDASKERTTAIIDHHIANLEGGGAAVDVDEEEAAAAEKAAKKAAQAANDKVPYRTAFKDARATVNARRTRKKTPLVHRVVEAIERREAQQLAAEMAAIDLADRAAIAQTRAFAAEARTYAVNLCDREYTEDANDLESLADDLDAAADSFEQATSAAMQDFQKQGSVERFESARAVAHRQFNNIAKACMGIRGSNPFLRRTPSSEGYTRRYNRIIHRARHRGYSKKNDKWYQNFDQKIVSFMGRMKNFFTGGFSNNRRNRTHTGRMMGKTGFIANMASTSRHGISARFKTSPTFTQAAEAHAGDGLGAAEAHDTSGDDAAAAADRPGRQPAPQWMSTFNTAFKQQRRKARAQAEEQDRNLDDGLRRAGY